PSTLRPRNGMMKLHEPRASMVMNSTMATIASTASTATVAEGGKRPQRRRSGPPSPRLVSSWLPAASADTRRPPQQHGQEQPGANEADDGADGDLGRVAQHAPEDVAQQHEACADDGDPRDSAPDVVADDEAHDVG